MQLRTYTNPRKEGMNRPLAILAILAILAGLAALIIVAERRRRITNTARYAPQMLESYGVPQPVIDHIIGQGCRLEAGRELVRGLLNDPILDMSLTTKHTTQMNEWLNATGPKEIN